ncbi:hydrolase [Saxibacter everestensis]|uniref:Hydrolase n=1 Tax=Saxibacter everestensis TaxID=2909229 RepID=A0ABY8QT07_9MICO|nr:hydrolase [Brevibacteriaceae bacterium ZFBP1038]
MSCFICATCGVQFPPSVKPPAECPVCEDARQYVPVAGQRWTTLEELRAGHRSEIRLDAGLTGIAAAPRFAIGQRALLVPHGDRVLMWDCQTLIDDDGIAAVKAAGGLSAIAISHPHYYSTMVEWAHIFDCPVLLHADDSRWIMRPDPAIELWDGEERDLGDGLTLLRLGGHFAGGTALHVERDAGTLLSGDIVQVIPDRNHVSFMYSYPNLIPLAEREVRTIADKLRPYRFERILGAWWDTLVPKDGDAIVQRSAERYIRALAGDYPPEN